MGIEIITTENVNELAVFMNEIKPEWWRTADEAYEQIADISAVIRSKGWVLRDENERMKGWLFTRIFEGYSCMEIECAGYSDNGVFALEDKLEVLIDEAEKYARENGVRILKIGRSSPGFSCHGKPIENVAEALKNLSAQGRPDYDFLLEFGFYPMGILPDMYEENHHMIEMVKNLF